MDARAQRATVVIIVLDNTVMSNFRRVGSTRPVSTAFAGQVVTTPAAFAELEAGIKVGKLPEGDWSWLGVVELGEAEMASAGELSSMLGTGEAACLALALARGWRIATDDRAARRRALGLGVPVTGTLGILQLLIDAGEIALPEAEALLATMQSAGYRSPVRSLSELQPQAPVQD